MKPILLAATALLATTAADARVAPPPRVVEPAPLPAQRHGAPDVPAGCAITVAFGSYGPGIDGATLARMERRLRVDRRVRSLTRHPWGREGEVTLCVYTRGAAGPLARQLRTMIAARPRGPVTVTLNRR